MDISEKTAQMSKYISKLLQENFGKGPGAVHVSIGQGFVIIFIRNFMSATERVLMKTKNEDTVHKTRDAIMEDLTPSITTTMHDLFNTDVYEFYFDWNLHNKTGMFVGVIEQPEDVQQISFEGQQKLMEEIDLISHSVQRTPDINECYQINDRAFVNVREGLLVPIEKELIRLGHEELLLLTKRKLEKSFLHNNSHFQKILHRRIVDIFVDWNFELDKSVILIITSPTQQPIQWKRQAQ
ncbi:DUF2294 domain-containing protein [Radiobacillus kanasensis]|uniref:Na-translocating system protein MpsC family protein n=1 Tax=Radiobacillus kanasensis TaxID=2844358 RepID=UPI001E3ACDBD|nr:Na-translocating system protein MpsC family protein [Radiobacillus kanasensis]UFT99993.1 DUF2294 domain-containing protein [Radiobacillus kanasensis]